MILRWYYCIKDLDNDISFAISYDTLTCEDDIESQGYYQLFAVVDKSQVDYISVTINTLQYDLIANLLTILTCIAWISKQIPKV
jgi:hypothetical protein